MANDVDSVDVTCPPVPPDENSRLSWIIPGSRIQLTESIGAGNFGEVWQGRLEGHTVDVAIKMLAARTVDEGDPVNPTLEEDFRNECEALQRLEHPNILRFYGYGTAGSGRGFIVTELVPYELY